MTSEEYERIAKLAYEQAVLRYGMAVHTTHSWENQKEEVRVDWRATVKLVERELRQLALADLRAIEAAPDGAMVPVSGHPALLAEVARLDALARKYSERIFDLLDDHAASAQTRRLTRTGSKRLME